MMSIFFSALLSFAAMATFAAPGDMDNDLVPDAEDIDADNDGLPNIHEGDGDSDGDGLPDYLDLDSDNDSIPDLIEAILDRDLLRRVDSNSDGMIDNGVDLGNNGFANPLELMQDSRSINYVLPDSDRDGLENFRDLDSDNDGLSDRIEYRNIADFRFSQIINFVDNNRNGIDDTVTNLTSFHDVDGDGFENAIDLDSDNDGLSDLLETVGFNVDRDNNGRIDQFLDLDGDGLHDALRGSPYQFRDGDNDGQPNHLDLDSDNDGRSDNQEAFEQGIANSQSMLDDSVTATSIPTTNSSDVPVTSQEVIAADAIDSTADNDSDRASANITTITTGLDGNPYGGCSIVTSKGQSAMKHSFGISEYLMLLLVLGALRSYRIIKKPCLDHCQRASV